MHQTLLNPKIMQTIEPMGAEIILPLVFQPKLRKKIEHYFAQTQKKYLMLGRAKKIGFDHRIIFLEVQSQDHHPFVFGKKIHEGSKGKIYHAFNMLTGEHIVIKMAPNMNQGHQTLKQAEIKREIRLLSKLSRYKGSLRTDEKFFIGQTYLHGVNLVQYFKACKKAAKNTKDTSQLLQLCKDILQIGLLFVQEIEQLHKKGYIHRDIKCSNCILQLNPKTKKARCFIIDFGGTNKKEKPYSRSLSTTSYRAPELAGKKMTYTQASDIFSTGKALEKLFRPFKEKNMQAFFQTTALQLQANINALLADMMAENADNRPNAKNIVKRLKKFIVQVSGFAKNGNSSES